MKRAIALLAPLCAGCSYFDLVGLQPDSPASLLVNLEVAQSETPSFEVHALLVRGTDAHGALQTPTQRAMYVQSRAIQPTSVNNGHSWSYHRRDTLANADRDLDSLSLTLPEFSMRPGPYRLALPLARREGTGDVEWTQGEDLRLRLSAVATPPEFSHVSRSWVLEIRRSCVGDDGGPILRILGGSAHPLELRVQWLTVLSSGQDSTMLACFQSRSNLRVLAAPYEVSIVLGVRMQWRIRIVRVLSGKGAAGFAMARSQAAR